MTPRRMARAIALACLLPTTTLAADLPPAPVLPGPPDDVFFWDGPYAGVHASLVMDASRLNYAWFATGSASAGAPYVAKVERSSYAGGVYGGWNRGFGPFVTGVEVDATLRGKAAETTLSGPDGSLKMRFSNDFSGTVRARGGYALGRLLLFGTIGVAYGQPRMRSAGGVYDPPPDGNTIGWAMGLGLDYAITDHAIARVEFLHSDFGSRSRTRTSTLTKDGVTTTAGEHDRFVVRQDVVRAGVAYKF